MTAQEKLARYKCKYDAYTRWGIWRGDVNRRRNRANIVLTRRIFAAAREKNGPFRSSAPDPSHTCGGTVAGALTCASCLKRKVPTIPLNSWAKLREAQKAAAQPIIAPEPKRKKATATKSCPHCGGSL